MTVNDELGSMWKEMIMTCFKVLSKKAPRGTKENREQNLRVTGFQAKNQTWELLNM
jgi:hypothetical protein